MKKAYKAKGFGSFSTKAEAIALCNDLALMQLSTTEQGNFIPTMNVKRHKILVLSLEIFQHIVRTATGYTVPASIQELGQVLFEQRDTEDTDNTGWGQYSLDGPRSCNHKRPVADPRDGNKVLKVPKWLKGRTGK